VAWLAAGVFAVLVTAFADRSSTAGAAGIVVGWLAALMVMPIAAWSLLTCQNATVLLDAASRTVHIERCFASGPEGVDIGFADVERFDHLELVGDENTYQLVAVIRPCAAVPGGTRIGIGNPVGERKLLDPVIHAANEMLAVGRISHSDA
jgi:hypothetical protein